MTVSNGLNRQQLVGFNQRNRDLWVAGKAKSLCTGARILDVGAGEGRYRPLFQHCDYQAQDFANYSGTAQGLLKEEWRYTKLDYVCDAAAIPVESNSFDAVLCTEVLEHVMEPITVLKELARILKPGGRLFLSAPLGSGLHQQPHHYYGGFTPHFYDHTLREAGLVVVSIEPNGRFFRMLLQELSRGVAIIQSRRSYGRWSAAERFLRAASSEWLARWFTQLDEEIPIDEFTVGYHVEAVKVGGRV